MTHRRSRRRPPLLALLPIVLAAGTVRGQGEPDAGDLLRQGLEQISSFNTERLVEARAAELARFVPAGRTVEVTVSYRVVKPAPAEGLEIAVLDELLPFPVKVLAERGVRYRQETRKVVGTGEYVERGGPAYPELRREGQVGWIEWNRWREKSATWAEERREALPPDEFQVGRRGTAERRAGLESVVAPAPQPAPQVDAAWFERSGQLLAAAGPKLREHPDARLGAVCNLLEDLHSRAAEPAWAPAPGGVLLSPAAAGELGDGLAIERVEVDGTTGEVRVVGGRSALALDRDLLATTLRLAFGGGGIPYFSLDPHDATDDAWYAERGRVSEALGARLSEDAGFLARFLEKSFEVSDQAGAPHRIAFLADLDPDLSRELDRTLPMGMDLVFRPRWLARTRLGEILFLADQSLKELWHGAAAFRYAPSRALAVEGRLAPKFWEPPNPGRELLAEALGRPPPAPVSSRWWFTPGGEVREGEAALDLSAVQPFLQTERIGGTGVATLEWQTPTGLTVTQEIVYDPLATALAPAEDPWAKAVLAHVNGNFDAYARAIPEWEALREIFRAYVFAIWLQRHDPDAGRRLLATLPPPLPPRRPLPKVWPDPRILVVRAVPDSAGFEVEQATICGGVGFERPFLRAAGIATGGAARSGGSLRGAAALLAPLAGDSVTPPWADDDLPATPEGYRAWRRALLLDRGLPWARFQELFEPGELLAFGGVALLLGAISLVRARRAARPLDGRSLLAATIDLLLTSLVLAVVAAYPSVYGDRAGPYRHWLVAVGFYAIVFAKADRAGRFSVTFLVMTIVLGWSLFAPGFRDLVAAWTPVRLARPPLDGTMTGPLAADTVYTLQALDDGLAISGSLEPRHALYPLLWLLSLLGLCADARVLAERGAPSRR